MQKILLLVVGNTKDGHIAALEKELLTRAKKYFQVDYQTVSASSFLSEEHIPKGISEETTKILAALKHAPRPTIYLDVAGKMCSTEVFADTLQKMKDAGEGATFIIGGAYGVDVKLLAPDQRLSLSLMTTTHELVRVLFLEQLYRAGSINAGAKYHHE